MKTVMIISDATGETAERMVRAATLQFSEPVQIRLHSRVRLESELEQILEKAAELRALVVFTVVNAEERDLIGMLVGISRTSKTPLSTYLAQRGLKVANVPLVLGVDPPEELSQVDDRKVFGLIVQPEMLMRIRQARLSHLGMPQDSSYGQRAHIDNEIAYSREIFRKHANWPVIDVTNRAIEETAADILRIYQERIEPSSRASSTG